MWTINGKIILDMGYLLFESQMELIDEFHVAISKLERLAHGGNNCFKKLPRYEK